MFGGCLCYLIKMALLNHFIHGPGFIQNLLVAATSGIPSIILIFLVLEVSKISNTRVIIKRLLKRAE